MSAPRTPSAEGGIVSSPARRSSSITRLFSFDSIQQCATPTEITYQQPQWEHSLASNEFLLKIGQLVNIVLFLFINLKKIKCMY